MNKLPSIPPSKLKDRTIDKLKELAEIWKGERGDKLDRVVTYRDLIQSKLGSLSRGGTLQPGDSAGIPTTSVGVLSNLTANGAFQTIILAWEGINQPAYSYTEIWRSEDDNLGNAVLIGSTVAAVYPDAVSLYRDYYYWVRAVSTSGNPGPFNATSGTVAKIAPDYETVRDFITATEWQASTAHSPLASVVPTTTVLISGVAIRLLATTAGTTGASEPNWAATITAIGDTVTDGSVVWTSVEAGKIPFYIDPTTGLVVIDGAAMRTASIDSAAINTLSVDKLFAASGTIAGALIGTADITNAMITNIIQSNNYLAGSAGWIINKSGTVEFRDGTFRGRIEADSGYISNTLQIGGTSYSLSQVVQMAEDADTSLFEAWIRPGTTLINGNKIFTGDAYVDTLQIKGQAVTFPSWATSSSNTNFSDAVWTTVLSLSVPRTGAPVSVFAAAGGSVSNTASGQSISGRLLRGGTVIDTFGIADSVITGTNEAGDTFATFGRKTTFMLDASAISGSTTYTLQVYGTQSGVCNFKRIMVVEMKR